MVTELVYGKMRRRRSLDKIIDLLAKKPASNRYRRVDGRSGNGLGLPSQRLPPEKTDPKLRSLELAVN
ncbi:MAG: hypothetical protein GDA43_18415 [Hormoscilla sp. SP5CHS1]|nr:hypothetical protein [Hormoscilla sp. SP5CHS1]